MLDGHNLDWTPLHPFGARVNLDLGGEIGEGQIDAMRQLYKTCRLLYFPRQKLSFDAQVRISQWFGPVIPEKAPTYVATDPAIGGLGDSEIAFHSDLSCAPEPLLGLSLHAVDVADEASPTRFADAVGAAAALPEDVRTKLKDLHIMNMWPLSLAKRQRRADAPDDWPGTAHPVLKPHPVTGAAILFLNASHSDRIIEFAADDSEALIQDLFARLYASSNCYEHRWRNGDFIVWDNLGLQHARPHVGPGVRRTLQRVEIGSKSYLDQMPNLDYAGLEASAS